MDPRHSPFVACPWPFPNLHSLLDFTRWPHTTPWTLTGRSLDAGLLDRSGVVCHPDDLAPASWRDSDSGICSPAPIPMDTTQAHLRPGKSLSLQSHAVPAAPWHSAALLSCCDDRNQCPPMTRLSSLCSYLSDYSIPASMPSCEMELVVRVERQCIVYKPIHSTTRVADGVTLPSARSFVSFCGHRPVCDTSERVLKLPLDPCDFQSASTSGSYHARCIGTCCTSRLVSCCG